MTFSSDDRAYVRILLVRVQTNCPLCRTLGWDRAECHLSEPLNRSAGVSVLEPMAINAERDRWITMTELMLDLGDGGASGDHG